MVFKVFISHSMEDAWIVYELHDLLKINGIEAYVAEWSLAPGVSLSEKIKAAIRECHCFLVLLTRDGTRSQWVHQELGIAEAYKKIIIPLVEKGVELSGLLEGKEVIYFERSDPSAAIKNATEVIRQLKMKKESGDAMIGVAAVALGLIGLSALAEAQES